jgi:hypothetical protein
MAALVLLVSITGLSMASSLQPAANAIAQVEQPTFPGGAVVPISERQVCSLLGEQKMQVGILGQDHGGAAELNGSVYWAFGDTALANGWMLPNVIGQSSDLDASDCVDLVPKQVNGQPEPLIRQAPGELTVWPVALEATSGTGMHFYYLSVVSDAVYGWRVQGAGVASFDVATLTSQRALGGALIWQGADPWPTNTYRQGTFVYVELIRTRGEATETLLARVPVNSLANPAAYQYWQPSLSGDGGSWLIGLWDSTTGMWRPELDTLRPLWSQPGYHNGAEMSFNSFLGRWTAVYTGDQLTSLKIRTAPSATGPWGEEAGLIECEDYYELSEPGYLCYSGAQLPFYERDGGRTLYASVSTTDDYQVYIHELRLASPVLVTTNGQGKAEYTAGTPSAPGNIAFYASDIPAPGLSAIHAWQEGSTGETRLAAVSPGQDLEDLGVRFHAPADAEAAAATHVQQAPVYRWSGPDTRYSPFDLTSLGYKQLEVAFFTPCPDSDDDGLTACEESFLGTNAALPDSDGDALEDGYEVSTEGCNPLVFNGDEGDGLAHAAEAQQGTSPCIWDGGAWGCVNGSIRVAGCVIDSDGDGCRDAWELGPNAAWGGQRDPSNPWDFFDAPGPSGGRDGAAASSILEILSLTRRFGASDAGGSAEVNRDSGLEAPVPQPPGYHPAFDRSTPNGAAWAGPPDGAIGMADVMLFAYQYGHTCQEARIPQA